MVCFESDERKDRVFIFLDRAAGDFVTSFATKDVRLLDQFLGPDMGEERQ